MRKTLFQPTKTIPNKVKFIIEYSMRVDLVVSITPFKFVVIRVDIFTFISL